MTREPSGSPITPRAIAGLLVVAVGVGLLADNLGILEVGNILRFWPLALIAVGVAKVMQDKGQSNQTGGWILIGIGVLFSIETLAFERFHVWRWWPLAIVFFGLVLIKRAFEPPPPPAPVEPRPVVPGMDPAPPPPHATGGKAAPDSTISDFVMWSGLERRVTSPTFRRADLTAIMGGVELDLRQAGTETGEAVVDVFVLWGGIEITVPPDWAVINDVTPIMGGAEDRSTGTQQARHRLRITGVVIMGGVDIKT
jgi:hypothetical protein